MTEDYQHLKAEYLSILPKLKEIAVKLEEQLIETFADYAHIDRIICRVKDVESFMTKSIKKKKDGSPKYAVPIKEIQDMIGARVVVYYKSDVPHIREVITQLYNRVEELAIVPDELSKFEYEAVHIICFIPNTIFSSRDNPSVTNFFELQIKTLYQHAWSQANHGLGYKPGHELSSDDQRMLYFIAAQSWAADKALADLNTSQKI